MVEGGPFEVQQRELPHPKVVGRVVTVSMVILLLVVLFVDICIVGVIEDR